MNAIEFFIFFFQETRPTAEVAELRPMGKWNVGNRAANCSTGTRPNLPAKPAKDDGGGDSWSSTGQVNFFLLQLIRDLWLAEVAG
jgi:hypothetical protein